MINSLTKWIKSLFDMVMNVVVGALIFLYTAFLFVVAGLLQYGLIPFLFFLAVIYLLFFK